jgi:hypothetical protein
MLSHDLTFVVDTSTSSSQVTQASILEAERCVVYFIFYIYRLILIILFPILDQNDVY